VPLRPSYKRLRHILVERDIKPVDLRRATDLGRNTMTSINADRSVSLETLAVICEFLNCRIEDVVEFIPED
jgi:DNA-binding Xre family transcriptional regulator